MSEMTNDERRIEDYKSMWKATLGELERKEADNERLRGIVEEQRLTIEALNRAIGGEGSTSLENIRRLTDQPSPTHNPYVVTNDRGEPCENALLPDGPVCPRCGGPRGPSGVDGGSWVHYPTKPLNTDKPSASRHGALCPVLTDPKAQCQCEVLKP